MPQRSFPQLYKLTSRRILELIRDLHLSLLNYKIIIVVDAHELYDYCFPINPNDAQGSIDIESLAESQAALNHLFKADEPDRPPVVLLDEYREELSRSLDAIDRKTEKAYAGAEIVSKIIQAGDFESISAEHGQKLERIVQDHFQLLLTILLGIHSLGAARMKEAYDKGLTSIFEAIKEKDKARFKEIWDGYRHSAIYDLIFTTLEADNTSPDPSIRAKTQRANRNDASAIDRLVYLNTETERVHLKYLFLYVSTAAKSRKVFELLHNQSALPVKLGRRYPFWRNRHQVLTYVIHRGRSENVLDRVKETIKELRSLNGLLRKVDRFEKAYKRELNECNECVLEGKTPISCKLSNYCEDVKLAANKIREKRDEVNNWGLFKQINSYRYLLQSQVKDLGHKFYLQLFADLVDDRKLKDIALERMYHRLIWIYRASEWTVLSNRVKEGFDRAKALDLRSEKDLVTGIDQYLPGKPRFQSAEYKEISNLILGFYRQPTNVDLFDEAYHRFIALEPESKQDEDEYDLLKCYLYLSFSFERDIHSYLKQMLLTKIQSTVQDATKRESFYILCWSARRSGLFREAEQYSLEGIKLYPDDARFFHGQALNIYAWLVQKGDQCAYTIIDAIVNSEKAVTLYKNNEIENRNVIAANHNNIAYFLALDVKTGEKYDWQERTDKLEKARDELKKLKDLIDKTTSWNPMHPEFFHTEAFVEYQEVRHFWFDQHHDKRELRTRLKSAKKDIATAIEIYDGPKYQELRSDIDEFFRKVVAGTLK